MEENKIIEETAEPQSENSVPVVENAPEGKSGKKQKVKKSLGREIGEWILTIVVALVIALTIRCMLFEPVKVDGHSMDDTLADGEIMLVSKFDYSTTWVQWPFGTSSQESADNCAKLVIGGNPERFDVVICHYPGRANTNFVKRVVGLPGDTVEIKDGYLYVNGEKYEETYINDEYRKTVYASSPAENFGPYTVPKKGDQLKNSRGETWVAEQDYYFVMGDHRNNSNDSRAQGPITRDMIVGHVRQVIFPFSSWRAVE